MNSRTGRRAASENSNLARQKVYHCPISAFINLVHAAPLRNPFFGTATLSSSPFSFQPPQSPSQWAPPPDFSPTKLNFQPQPEELKDIDMADASAASPSPPKSRKRQYKSRHKLNPSSLSVVLRNSSSDDHDDDNDNDEDEDTQRTPRRRQRRRGNDGAPVPHTMSHHYTLNMNQGPAAGERKADMPYILLG